jgi:hypothetical protein
MTHTDNNDVKQRLEIPALALNETQHQTTQFLYLFECRAILNLEGERFRHLPRYLSEAAQRPTMERALGLRRMFCINYGKNMK